jgi:serine protease
MKKNFISIAVGIGLSATSTAYADSDQLIIKYQDGVDRAQKASAMAMANISAKASFQIQHKRFTFDRSQVVRLAKKYDDQALKSIIRRLEADPDIEYVEVDRILKAAATANDQYYSSQWHYHDPLAGINLETAWDSSTGAGVRVAVIDTGYLPHVDLADNIIGGYDFIVDTTTANDGDGRDSDASDPGDWYGTFECGLNFDSRDSSWHGTHVAGTVAALTNNSIGVAGIAHDAEVVPVRVLGKCGGYTSDIADGIVWASGGSVSGVPANSHPAKVLNLSLGGSGSCGATTQNAVNTARSNGAVVVVASGNSNSDVSGFTPGNCNGVISVAATNKQADRASYSNYGSLIDIAAPGGEGGQDGVASTLNDGTTTPANDVYAYYAGTSMAAPHVAGVAALMFSVNPNLTPDQVEQAIKDSARAFPSGSSCSTSNCGAGILDAAAAVAAVDDGNPPDNQPPVADFTFNCTDLSCNFDGSSSSDSDGTISSYSWSFGGTGVNASHTFASAGTYSVTLTVTDDDGATDTSTQSVTVSEEPENEPPTASFTFNCNDLSCNFDASSSSDSDGNISAYDWSFGAGGVTASHTFASAGSYSVTLTVTDNEGATDDVTQTVTVTEPEPSDITLSVSRAWWGYYAVLNWDGASGSSVDIYRNGQLRTSTANDGSYSEFVSRVSYTYKVCESGSTTNCSDEVVSNP